MKKIFDQKGDFQASSAAEQWLKENGYSVGPPQRGSPRGILKGDFIISKWRNMTQEERNALDGTLTGDGRNGPITITLKDD